MDSSECVYCPSLAVTDCSECDRTLCWKHRPKIGTGCPNCRAQDALKRHYSGPGRATAIAFFVFVALLYGLSTLAPSCEGPNEVRHHPSVETLEGLGW